MNGRLEKKDAYVTKSSSFRSTTLTVDYTLQTYSFEDTNLELKQTKIQRQKSDAEKKLITKKNQIEGAIQFSMDSIIEIYKRTENSATLDLLLDLTIDLDRDRQVVNAFQIQHIHAAVYEWALQQKDSSIDYYLEQIEDGNIKRKDVMIKLNDLYQNELKKTNQDITNVEQQLVNIKTSINPLTLQRSDIKRINEQFKRLVNDIQSLMIKAYPFFYKNPLPLLHENDLLDTARRLVKEYPTRVCMLEDQLKEIDRLNKKRENILTGSLSKELDNLKHIKSCLEIEIRSLGFRINDKQSTNSNTETQLTKVKPQSTEVQPEESKKDVVIGTQVEEIELRVEKLDLVVKEKVVQNSEKPTPYKELLQKGALLHKNEENTEKTIQLSASTHRLSTF